MASITKRRKSFGSRPTRLSLNKKRKRGKNKRDEVNTNNFDMMTTKSDNSGNEWSDKEEEFDEDEGTVFSKQLKGLQETDPDFYNYLQENDKELLNFESDVNLDEEEEGDDEGEGEEEKDESGEEGLQEEEEKGKEVVKVTSELISQWKKNLKKEHSLPVLTELIGAFHYAIISILTPPSHEEEEKKKKKADKGEEILGNKHYVVHGGDIFNSLVLSCLQLVCPVLEHHLPPPSSSTSKHSLPSTHKRWGRLRNLVKCYLLDVLQLLNGVTDPSMVCALLRHIDGLWIYYSCFPKLSRHLTKGLVKAWAQGRSDDGTTVISFLLLRKVYLVLNKEKRENLLKQLYLSYIRNSRYTTPSSLPHIRFMCGSLVELLSLTPDHAYQLIFIYTRQLANQLRSALTNKTTPIATWPFIHSLELFTSVLGSCPDPILSPLIYPVTQIGMGVIHHLSSSLYIPTRLHIVKMFLNVAMETNTYIPLAPVLLEILESQSASRSSGGKDGGGGAKPPNLLCTLKLRKTHVNSRGTQSAVLNATMDLLLRLLVGNSHHISFPEMSFPTVIRMRKMIKTTPVSWFRHHMKQIIDKTEAASKLIMEARSGVTFSPKDSELIDAWEREHKEVSNPLKSFMDTWQVIQRQLEEKEKEEEEKEKEEEEEDSDEEEGKKSKKKRKVSTRNDGDSSSKTHSNSSKRKKKVESSSFLQVEGEEEKEDLVEEFELSSNDDDDDDDL